MKRLFVLFISAVFLLSCFAGCGGQEAKKEADGQKKLKVVATVFPIYDWTREIMGENSENGELTLLLDKGVDLHSFQPTSKDIMKLSDADVFIYVGGESDDWVKDAVKEAKNKKMVVLNLMDELGDKVKREEAVEGMEEAHHHREENDHAHHEEEQDHEASDKHEGEYDEHIWLSLKNAKVLCPAIAEALAKADTANGEVYEKNCSNYVEKLDALDKEYQKAADAAQTKTLIFGDRFPFRYLADDYGLKYYAAFVGCSAETEASFETIVFLSKKISELKPPVILALEGRTHKIPEAIVKNSSQPQTEIKTVDSMQSTTEQEAKTVTYLSVMEKNLALIKTALK